MTWRGWAWSSCVVSPFERRLRSRALLEDAVVVVVDEVEARPG